MARVIDYTIKGLASIGFGAVVGVIILAIEKIFNLPKIAVQSAAAYFGLIAAGAVTYCLQKKHLIMIMV